MNLQVFFQLFFIRYRKIAKINRLNYILSIDILLHGSYKNQDNLKNVAFLVPFTYSRECRSLNIKSMKRFQTAYFEVEKEPNQWNGFSYITKMRRDLAK